MPAKSNDPQGNGSRLTYQRRYALGAILGIATEPDDDGNAGAGDYHHGSGDLAVDSGIDVGLLTDKDGVVIPQKAGYDLGPYEATTYLDSVTVLSPHMLRAAFADPIPATKIDDVSDWILSFPSGSVCPSQVTAVALVGDGKTVDLDVDIL